MATKVSIEELKKNIALLNGDLEGEYIDVSHIMSNEKHEYHDAVIDACMILGGVNPKDIPTWGNFEKKCIGLKDNNSDRIKSLELQNIFDDVCFEYLYEKQKAWMYEKLIETNDRIKNQCLLTLAGNYILDDRTYSDEVEIEPKTEEGLKRCLSYIAESGYKEWKEKGGALYTYNPESATLEEVEVTEEKVRETFFGAVTCYKIR